MTHHNPPKSTVGAAAAPAAIPGTINPFSGATMDPAGLAAAAKINPSTLPPVKEPEPVVRSNQEELAKGGKSYQFPSAPTTYEFRRGKRAHIPDGVYTTSDPDEIAELDEAVYVGNLYYFTGDVTSVQQLAPPPVSPDRLN